MTPQILIGFATEGSTDASFLENIIQKTFEDVAFECHRPIEVLPIRHLNKQTGNFMTLIENYAQKAFDSGLSVLCIHTDADDNTDMNAFDFKINPAFDSVMQSKNKGLCKNLVAIVPIQMIESWMLADKTLLKREIGTDKTDNELGINRDPESVADPKQMIEDAIRIGRQDMTKRRRKDLAINDLYQIIGTSINLETLETLSSFRKFRVAVQEAFKQMNYLH
jgi:Domain of unknown function (DUF4276)